MVYYIYPTQTSILTDIFIPLSIELHCFTPATPTMYWYYIMNVIRDEGGGWATGFIEQERFLWVRRFQRHFDARIHAPSWYLLLKIDQVLLGTLLNYYCVFYRTFHCHAIRNVIASALAKTLRTRKPLFPRTRRLENIIRLKHTLPFWKCS